MKPRYANTNTTDLQVVRREVKDFADLMGEGSGGILLKDTDGTFVFVIDTAETPVPHGQAFVPRWRAYNVAGNAAIWQSQPADAKFLYLQASASVECGLEVF